MMMTTFFSNLASTPSMALSTSSPMPILPRLFPFPSKTSLPILLSSSSKPHAIAAQPDSADQIQLVEPNPTKKPVYSMKKGQLVRVYKEKYLNSLNVGDTIDHSFRRRKTNFIRINLDLKNLKLVCKGEERIR